MLKRLCVVFLCIFLASSVWFVSTRSDFAMITAVLALGVSFLFLSIWLLTIFLKFLKYKSDSSNKEYHQSIKSMRSKERYITLGIIVFFCLILLSFVSAIFKTILIFLLTLSILFGIIYFPFLRKAEKKLDELNKIHSHDKLVEIANEKGGPFLKFMVFFDKAHIKWNKTSWETRLIILVFIIAPIVVITVILSY